MHVGDLGLCDCHVSSGDDLTVRDDLWEDSRKSECPVGLNNLHLVENTRIGWCSLCLLKILVEMGIIIFGTHITTNKNKMFINGKCFKKCRVI
jgi:hypothetical protein